MTTTKWFLPSVSVALGGLCAAAFWVGGDPHSALFSLGVMSALALVVLAGGRSELIRGLRGDGRDEYWDGVDRRATLCAGMVTLTLVLGMCLWEWAHGRSGTPYVQLGAIGGLAYVLALAAIRVRG